MSIKKKVFLLEFTLVIIVFVVYANSLSGGFILDDWHQVFQNPWIKGFGHIREIILSGAWEFEKKLTNYYRPLMHLTYMLIWNALGESPVYYHWVNIALHAANTVLVFVLSRRLMKIFFKEEHLLPAFIGSAIFAIHPIHTEAVDWIASVPELSFTFFGLSSFYFYLRSDGRMDASYWVSAFLFFIALLGKETAVALLPVLVLYDILARGQKAGLAMLKKYAPFALVLFAYATLRYFALKGLELHVFNHIAVFFIIINIFPLFFNYFLKLFFPADFWAWHIFNPYATVLNPGVVISILFFAAFVFILVMALKKDKASAFCLLFLTLPLLPALNIPVMPKCVFAERYLYFPSVGLSLLVAVFLSRRKRLKIFEAAGLILIMLLFSVNTFARNKIWDGDDSFWKDDVFKTAIYKQENLTDDFEKYQHGVVFYKEGRMGEAIKNFKAVLGRYPSSTIVLINLGMALEAEGRGDEAAIQYKDAIKADSRAADAYYNLGNILLQSGKLKEAEENFRKASEIKRDADTFNQLGLTYYREGLIDRSVESFREAIGINPRYAQAYNNMAISLFRKGDFKDAFLMFRKAFELEPGNEDFEKNMERAERMNLEN